MKKYTTAKKLNKNKITDATDSEVEWSHLDFDEFTNQVDQIARRKLPDGVMGGNLAGSEAEVRQETALMLMKCFLFRNLAADSEGYHLGKVVAIALRYQKTRMKGKLADENARCGAL